MELNLYHVSQSVNNDYDTYSDFVIACESEEVARNTHPNGDKNEVAIDERYSGWVHVSKVDVKLIGKAIEGVSGVICESFHAG